MWRGTDRGKNQSNVECDTGPLRGHRGRTRDGSTRPQRTTDEIEEIPNTPVGEEVFQPGHPHSEIGSKTRYDQFVFQRSLLGLSLETQVNTPTQSQTHRQPRVGPYPYYLVTTLLGLGPQGWTSVTSRSDQCITITHPSVPTDAGGPEVTTGKWFESLLRVSSTPVLGHGSYPLRVLVTFSSPGPSLPLALPVPLLWYLRPTVPTGHQVPGTEVGHFLLCH